MNVKLRNYQNKSATFLLNHAVVSTFAECF
jgi:hypothetical protein